MKYERFLKRDVTGYDRNGFIAYLQGKERAENTIAAYVYALDEFFAAEQELSQESVIRYKKKLLEDRKPATVNLRLCGIRAYAEYRKIPISVNPVKIQKVSFAEDVISQADYERLIEGLRRDENWKWYFLIRFLACTGARISELLQFKKQDLNAGFIELWTKGKVRIIYFPDRLLEESREHYARLRPEEFLFSGKKGVMTSRSVGEMLHKIAMRYGIPQNVMHPHSFRHRFAINFLKKKQDISLLADIMGHSSVNTTMIYLRLSKQEQREAVNTIVDW